MSISGSRISFLDNCTTIDEFVNNRGLNAAPYRRAAGYRASENGRWFCESFSNFGVNALINAKASLV
jgi:hypothetical protein